MKRAIWFSVSLFVSVSVLLGQAPGEVGFVEDFALAADRAAALKELIPGTEEYYYYHCLHFQNTGELEQAAEMLRRWKDRYRDSAKWQDMQNRQVLLRYEVEPAQALARIRERLGLSFAHVRREREQETNYPTVLNPELLDRAALDRQAFASDRLLGGFSEAAWRRLAAMELTPERQRTLLDQLALPDVPNLVDLVVADLQEKDSGGFGARKIHAFLTLAQLDACAVRLPNLLGERAFLSAYLQRLVPKSDEDVETPAVRLAYLERMQAFADRLPPVWNSLKANILYRRLEFDRTQDIYDRERFLAYLRLPRSTGYIRRDYLRQPGFQGQIVNLREPGGDFPVIREAIQNDEPLVRAYLHRFLVDADGYPEFAPYIEEAYLREVHAEANILAGVGDQERWQAMMAPERLRALRERVDIELLPTCPPRFGVADPVQLAVAVKNVPSLLVRVYEINTFNYYRAKGIEVGTSVDLDGLVANREETFTYDQPALRRHVETFSFPELNRPGVWVIELIGNGRSSRAVIRKGALRYTERRGAAGHVFRVFDQDHVLVKDASLWLGNQEYRPEESGEIVVPFATSRKPEPTTFVLRRGEFASLGAFQHATEFYSLDAAFSLELESLVQGETARLLIRPRLLVNGVRVDVGLLEQVELTLNSMDIHGIDTSRTYRDLKLFNDQETVCEFRVPPDLSLIGYTLTGKVRNVSQGREESLSAGWNQNVNSIDCGSGIASLHLRPTAEGYVLELLGKTGEPLAGRVVRLHLTHAEYSHPIHATLQTDVAGRVRLGTLPGVVKIEANAADSRATTFHLSVLEAGAVDLPKTLDGMEGDTFQLPFVGTAQQVTLLEVGESGGEIESVRADRHGHVAVADGLLTIRGLPAGDYIMLLHDAWGTNKDRVRLRVVPGERQAGWVMGPQRFVEAGSPQLLGIRSATLAPAGEAGKERLTIRLANATPDTRVQVLVGRYAFPDPFGFFRPELPAARVFTFPPVASYYVSGRDLGDEFRYVLERRGAARRPGNLLTKPSLLLNPWSLGETKTEEERLREGTAYQEVAKQVMPSAPAPTAVSGGRFARRSGSTRSLAWGGDAYLPKYPEFGGGSDKVYFFANYDYLATPALVVANLRPDADGVVTVELEPGGRQFLQVVAMNGQMAVRQPVLRPLVDEPTRDLRMRQNLPADQHVTEQKRVDIVAAGQTFTVADMRSSKVQTYATLAEAYGLLKTLSEDGTLAEFEFVCRWPGLSAEEKRTLYGKYACHELSFFLYQKDRAFFDEVVRPYLAHKKDKTFLDHWLLGNDLAAYLEPWAYGRLNIVERILLARRLPAERAAIRRHVQDLHDLLPPDIEGFNRRFDTAVKSAALDEGVETRAAGGAMMMGGEMGAMGGGMGGGMGAPGGMGGGMGGMGMMPGGAPAAAGAVRSRADALDLKADEAEKMLRPAPPRPAAAAEPLAEMGDATFYTGDRERRETQRQLYRAVETTEEWVENNYYHVPIAEQTAGLIQVNGFWRDYAVHEGDGPFLSTHFAEATRNFAEMMLALAVLDLPLAGEAPEPVFAGEGLSLTPKHSVIVFHQQVREGALSAATPLLLGQNFYAADDRYRHENNRQYDKFVTEEFQTDRIYGCQVVVTNPTSTPREIDVLLSIPQGAIPVNSGFRTRGFHLLLGGYSTETLDYLFYFPVAGEFPIYPAHAAQDGELLAYAPPFRFRVVETLTKIDTTSWDYVSQYGSEDEVVEFLKTRNVDRLDLDLIAFRMKSPEFFARVLPLLRSRYVFAPTLWSYGVLHNDPQAIREYLPHTPLAESCGVVFHSPLLTVEPVPRAAYQHKEYWPLINARSHRVGGRPRILNQQFLAQYTAYLTMLAHRPRLDDEENLTLAMYLLLQDRVEEALAAFGKVDPARVAERMPYDYLRAYLAFAQADVAAARTIAQPYRDYPVPRWRNLFAEILGQCAEIEGAVATVADPDSRAQTQAALAATQPSFEFVVEGGEIRLEYLNLASVEVNFYRMDLELLFSRTPFLMDVAEQFSIIRPNATQRIELAAGQTVRNLPIPPEFASVNTMIEVVGSGQRKLKPHYPHAFTVQVIEAYGQLQVVRTETRKPLPAVYVKVYARRANGQAVFFKDGYTDLRGRFDYASVSTGDVKDVQRFAILVLSDEAGAAVREAPPPTR